LCGAGLCQQPLGRGPGSPQAAAAASHSGLLIEDLESAGALRDEISRQEGADTVWAVNSTEVYQLMTETRGWSPQHYQQWLTETLCRLLLPDGV
jgi:hypothetical protein